MLRPDLNQLKGVNDMTNELSVLLQSFFREWLMKQKRVSPNTTSSYRYTFRLLLEYAKLKLKKVPSKLNLNDLSVDFLSDFLKDLIINRNVTARTRNARLAAIKSFFRYVAFYEPGYSALCSRVLAITESKFPRKQVNFLSEDELDILLKTQDLNTWVGRRDHVMILVAIETGLRLSELISLKWADIFLKGSSGYIQCFGKGRKERSTPLSPETVKTLHSWKSEMDLSKSEFVFPNKKRAEMSVDCFQKQLKKYSKLAANQCKSLQRKKISPHTLRHTAAMNLLQAGVDIATIAMILGHESIETTGIYLEENMKMKEEALKKLKPRKEKFKRFKAGDALQEFLNSL
jgi:integrase/recombinase XerD